MAPQMCPVPGVGNVAFPLGKQDKGWDFPFLPPNLELLPFPRVFHCAGYCQSFLSGAVSVDMPHGGLGFCQHWALLTI